MEVGTPGRQHLKPEEHRRGLDEINLRAKGGRMDLRPKASAHGLEQVFLEHRPRLLRFLQARGAGDRAEDLLQDIWLRVVAGAPGPVANPLAYLHRIADNLVLDMRRSERRSGQRELAWHETRGEVEAPLGERALIAREQLRRVEADMAKLGERVAIVFRRYRLDNVSQRQIAAELGISLSAVEKDLQRAYRALAEIRRRDDAV